MSSAYKEALSDTEQKLLENTFGEDATSAEALYVRLVCHWQGTNDQRKRAKKEFEGVQVLQGETAYQFLGRVKFYVEKAGKCGTARPDVGEFTEKVFKAVESGERMTEAAVRVLVKGGKKRAKDSKLKTESEKIKSLKVKIETYKKVIDNLKDENKKLSKLLSNRKELELLA